MKRASLAFATICQHVASDQLLRRPVGMAAQPAAASAAGAAAPDLAALLDEARRLAASAAGDAGVPNAAAATLAARHALRALLRQVSPDRRRVSALDNPAVRRRVQEASAAELLAALEADVAPALQRASAAAAAAAAACDGDESATATPYRLVERAFRAPAGPRDRSRASVLFAGADGVATVDDALACGAIDFGATAAWRTDDALRMRLGVVAVAPPSSSPPLSPPTGGFGGSGGGVYTLTCSPGFYCLPGYLSCSQQEGLAVAVLRRYAERPNRRNVDASFDPDASNLIMAAAGEPRGGDYGRAVAAVTCAGGGGGGGDGSVSPPQPAVHTAAPAAGAPGRFPSRLWAGHLDDLRARQGAAGDAAADADFAHLAPSRDGWLSKLTWCTLGQQYDWTARSYHLPRDADYALHAKGDGAAAAAPQQQQREGRWFAPFPADLAALTAGVADAVHAAASAHYGAADDAAAAFEPLPAPDGVPRASPVGLPLAPFTPQAGIVNVYQYGPGGRPLRGVPMGGHRDDMERRWDRPVVSLNVGCAAVYLLGGPRKEDAPVPVLVRSGDAMLLSGACRLAFHGVARVFDGTAPVGLFAGPPPPPPPQAGDGDDDGPTDAVTDGLERAALRAFVAHTRINVNVRQVV
jgi:alkylated DNA repair dioxygenase AlkB